MPKPIDILGMNARNQQYVSMNSALSKSIANSKIATNLIMRQNGIPVPEQHALFLTSEDVQTYDWANLQDNFVVKPTSGLAGKGVLIFRKRIPNQLAWHDAVGKKWSKDDIVMHCLDILEGQYSSHGGPNIVILQERITIHPAFKKFTYKGTPDIRVIVFNQVPIMAMLRLPTKKSEGRANTHQGAIAVGIDLATGYTTGACTGKGSPIIYLPDTKIKLRGFKIPNWKSCLIMATKATNAANLVYCGVDLFLHVDKGPMVVELNARPGLTIQIANGVGLRRRLERVRGLNVLSPEHGVKIAQALFASNLSTKLKTAGEQVVIGPSEKIKVLNHDKKGYTYTALINTGRLRSAVAEQVVRDLALTNLENLLWYQQEKKEGLAPVVELTFVLKDEKIKTAMVVSKRLNRANHQVELGRKDLQAFLIKPSEKPV